MRRKSTISSSFWAVVIFSTVLVLGARASFFDIVPDTNQALLDDSGIGLDASLSGSKSIHLDKDKGLLDKGAIDVIKFKTKTTPPPPPPPPPPAYYPPPPRGKPCKRDAGDAAAAGGAQQDPNSPDASQQIPPPAADDDDADGSDSDDRKRREVVNTQIEQVADDFRKFLNENKINLTKQDEDLLTQFKNHQKEKLSQKQARSAPAEPALPGHPVAVDATKNATNSTHVPAEVVVIEESRVFRSIPSAEPVAVHNQTNATHDRTGRNPVPPPMMMGSGQPMMGSGQPMMGSGQPMMGMMNSRAAPDQMMSSGQPMMGSGQPMMGSGQPMMGSGQPMMGMMNSRAAPEQVHANLTAGNATEAHHLHARAAPEHVSPNTNATAADPHHQLNVRVPPDQMMGSGQPMMGSGQPMMGSGQPMMGSGQPMMGSGQPMMGMMNSRAAPDQNAQQVHVNLTAANATEAHHLHARAAPEHVSPDTNATAADPHQLHLRAAPAANQTDAANATNNPHHLHARAAPEQPATDSNATAAADPHQLHLRAANQTDAANATNPHHQARSAPKNETGDADKKKDKDDDDDDDDDTKAHSKRAISPRLSGMVGQVMNYFN